MNKAKQYKQQVNDLQKEKTRIKLNQKEEIV